MDRQRVSWLAVRLSRGNWVIPLVGSAFATPGATILVVEETPTVGMLIRVNLAQRGYRVLETDNIDRALALIRAGEVIPSAVLLEPHSVVADWQHTLQRLARTPQLARTPILLVTTLNITLAAARETCSGVVDVLNKPFDTADLVARLETALQGRSS